MMTLKLCDAESDLAGSEHYPLEVLSATLSSKKRTIVLQKLFLLKLLAAGLMRSVKNPITVVPYCPESTN